MSALAAPTAVAHAPKTFIRATEVWRPDEAGVLRLASGVYGDLTDFAAVSGDESFPHGEGLPGRAWAERRPIVLKGFAGSYFKRTEAAEAAGLTAAIALPSFAGETLTGVLVFLFSDDADHIGAVEVWTADDGADALALSAGYFGAAQHFEWISKHTQFPRGQGLPGVALKTGSAALFRDLGAGYRFIRAESAADAGLTSGLGLPIETPGTARHVVTLLSARGTPIARRFEIWSVDPTGEASLLDGAEGAANAFQTGAAPTFQAGEGAIGFVVQSGAPLALDNLDVATAGPGERAAAAAGYRILVAFPVYRDGRLVQVAAWYF